MDVSVRYGTAWWSEGEDGGRASMNRTTSIVASVLGGVIVFLLSCGILMLVIDVLPIYGTPGAGDAYLSLVLFGIGFIVAIAIGVTTARFVRSWLVRP